MIRAADSTDAPELEQFFPNFDNVPLEAMSESTDEHTDKYIVPTCSVFASIVRFLHNLFCFCQYCAVFGHLKDTRRTPVGHSLILYHRISLVAIVNVRFLDTSWTHVGHSLTAFW